MKNDKERITQLMRIVVDLKRQINNDAVIQEIQEHLVTIENQESVINNMERKIKILENRITNLKKDK